MDIKKHHITLKCNTRQLFIDGKEISPSRSQKLINHSPDGFAWGYGGSGPAQLALAILLEIQDEDCTRQDYQDFKWDVIANLSLTKSHEFVLALNPITRKWEKEENYEIRTDE